MNTVAPSARTRGVCVWVRAGRGQLDWGGPYKQQQRARTVIRVCSEGTDQHRSEGQGWEKVCCYDGAEAVPALALPKIFGLLRRRGRRRRARVWLLLPCVPAHRRRAPAARGGAPDRPWGTTPQRERAHSGGVAHGLPPPGRRLRACTLHGCSKALDIALGPGVRAEGNGFAGAAGHSNVSTRRRHPPFCGPSALSLARSLPAPCSTSSSRPRRSVGGRVAA